MSVGVVIPTCRQVQLTPQTADVTWYVVHDEVERDVLGDGKVVNIVAPEEARYGSKSDSIRSEGILQAFKDGHSHIITTDDDVLLTPGWAQRHVDALESSYHPWHNTLTYPRVRGMPYEATLRPVAISHGVWAGVPDLDALTQQANPTLRVWPPNEWSEIAPPFPQSAMNLGWKREVTVCMYMPPQGPSTPFDRYSDIWCGLFAQRVLSLHGYTFANGGALVYHTRASSVEANLVKEAPGMECHESLWRHIWAFNDVGQDMVHTYAKLAYHLGTFDTPNKEWRHYFKVLKGNMLWWIDQVTL